MHSIKTSAPVTSTTTTPLNTIQMDMEQPCSTTTACTVIVRQSVLSATVTCLVEGGPLCSWMSLLGEGLVSLNDQIPPLSHWSDHQRCNSPCVDPQSSPSFSYWGVLFLMICWSVDLIYMSPALKISRVVVNVTYWDL